MADQVNISWKADSNGKQIFQAALDKWGADKPKSAGAGDFILDLIRRADKAEAAIETNSRLEALGIKELVEMHQRRAQADARMLEQIADLIADAQGKAESAVKAELEALKAGKANLESSIQKVTAELERSRQELEDLKAQCRQVATEKAESDKQCKQLQDDLEKVKGQLDKATLASEQAASQLEQEKLASIALKENAVRHESEINAIQKKANDTETAYRQKVAELEHQIAKAQTEQEQAEIAHQSALNESHKQRSEAEAVYRDEILKLKGEIQNGQITAEAKIKEMQGEQAKAQLEASHQIDKLQSTCDQLTEKLEQAQKERHEREKAVAELAEARIKIASLEATVKGQQESISNMGKTMEILRNFKPVLQKQPPKLEVSTTTGNIGKTVQSGQQDKTK